MTNQEAITKLTNIMHDDIYSWSPAILTAFGMAVDALKGARGDSISRQTLKDAFVDTSLLEWEQLKKCFPMLEVVDEVPSAQPEIIRCRDCKWYEGDIMANPWGVCCHHGWVGGNSGHEVSENGWCYRAERRTDA